MGFRRCCGNDRSLLVRENELTPTPIVKSGNASKKSLAPIAPRFHILSRQAPPGITSHPTTQPRDRRRTRCERGQTPRLPMKTPATPPPEKLPDPWLFDSEALLRELDRCLETILQIPITNPNATHFGIQLAVSAVYNLTENLRHLLHLHREQQRSIRRQHDAHLAEALARPASNNIVRIHTPTPSTGKKTNNITATHSPRARFAKRRRAQSPHDQARRETSQVA